MCMYVDVECMKQVNNVSFECKSLWWTWYNLWFSILVGKMLKGWVNVTVNIAAILVNE